MTEARRRRTFAVLAVVCVLFAAGAVVAGLQGAEAPVTTASAAHAALLDAAPGHPAAVFRDGGGGVAVSRPDGTRALAPLRCDRVYFAGGRGLCLTRGRGFAAGYRAEVFDSDFKVVHSIDVAGIPSRARVSPDGNLGAVTMFVTGHSYAEAGAFSTQTTIFDLKRGRVIADLEDFTVMRGAREVTAVDQNFWGITFSRDGDRFYATLATAGRTHLIEGSISERRAKVLHDNVECPSLSPDGARIAYKRRTGSSERPWQLTVLDLRTQHETPLAETRSIDDQAEWLDDSHVLYGIGGAIFVVPADGSGAPRRFFGRASSPAVVRT